MIRIPVLLLLCIAAAFQSFARADERSRKLDSIFSYMHAQRQFNGSVLIAEKGAVIFKRSYGLSNESAKASNDPSTIFEIASCTKQFTAAAIVLLHRQGKLRYDDSLGAFLPGLRSWSGVRIHDLLRHTSGIPDYIGDMGEDYSHTATNADLIRFYTARQDSLMFAAGSRHRYCNTNYALLASIIETVSGTSYAAFLREQIFRPLQMTRTSVYCRRIEPRRPDNFAIGYTWATGSFKKVVGEDPGKRDSLALALDGIVGGAKVASTVEDIYKWIRALKNNTLFTQAEFDTMTAVTRTSSGDPIPYGFGLDVSKRDGRFAFGHTGSWDGYASFMYHDVVRDRTIITLQNFNLGGYPFEAISQILDHKPVVAEYRRMQPLPEGQIRKFCGVYSDTAGKGDPSVISYLDGYLVFNTKKLNWDMRFFPVSENEFLGIRQGNTDSILRFTTLENGDIRLEMLEYGDLIGGGVRKKS